MIVAIVTQCMTGFNAFLRLVMCDTSRLYIWHSADPLTKGLVNLPQPIVPLNHTLAM